MSTCERPAEEAWEGRWGEPTDFEEAHLSDTLQDPLSQQDTSLSFQCGRKGCS